MDVQWFGSTGVDGTQTRAWRHLVITFPCQTGMCVDGSIEGGPHVNDDGSTNDGSSGLWVCPAFPRYLTMTMSFVGEIHCTGVL